MLQRILWKNLSKRLLLSHEYKSMRFEERFLGFCFKSKDPFTDEDRRLCLNTAISCRERVNGRSFLNFFELVEGGCAPDFSVYRRSGAMALNAHMAREALEALVDFGERGIIPPVLFEGEERDPIIHGSRKCVKVKFLWCRVPEDAFSRGSEKFIGVWRVSYGERCLLLVFRNWINPVHRSRLIRDMLALAALAESHSRHFREVVAAIFCPKAERPLPTITYATNRQVQPFPNMPPHWRAVKTSVIVADGILHHVQPKALVEPRRETAVPLEVAYPSPEHLSENARASFANWVMRTLHLNGKSEASSIKPAISNEINPHTGAPYIPMYNLASFSERSAEKASQQSSSFKCIQAAAKLSVSGHAEMPSGPPDISLEGLLRCEVRRILREKVGYLPLITARLNATRKFSRRRGIWRSYAYAVLTCNSRECWLPAECGGFNAKAKLRASDALQALFKSYWFEGLRPVEGMMAYLSLVIAAYRAVASIPTRRYAHVTEAMRRHLRDVALSVAKAVAERLKASFSSAPTAILSEVSAWVSECDRRRLALCARDKLCAQA